MKKFLIGVLATVSCFACLSATACGGDDGKGLEEAAAKVSKLYDANTLSSGFDYEVVNEVVVNDVTYTVSWEVDVTSGVKVVPGTSKTKIDVDEDKTSKVSYVLTATVTDAKGKTQTVTFNCVAPEMVFSVYDFLPDDASGTKLYMKDTATSKEYYFNGKSNGSSLAFTEKRSESVDVTITKPYETLQRYLTFEDAYGATQYLGVENVYEDGAWKNVLTFKDAVEGYDQSSRFGEFMWTYDTTLGVWKTDVKDVKSGTSQTATNGKDLTFYVCANADFSSVEVTELKNNQTENDVTFLEIGKIAKKA